MRRNVLVWLCCIATCWIVTVSHAAPGHAKTLCTVVADSATGRVLARQGACGGRVTPASTFKIAIALMGFDAGVLADEHTPVLSYRDGEPDWGGDAWRQPTDPTRWIAHSVVWFSQRVTRAIGQERFQAYTRAFRYGNADVSGEPGRGNGVMGAWINSSLRISPLEQIAFLRGVANRTLPVSAHAFDMTERILRLDVSPDGWSLYGKTGTGCPGMLGPDGAFDRAHAYGWFVGWAKKGARTLVFAHLIQDGKPGDRPAGVRAREAFVRAFPAYAAKAGQ